MAKKRSHQHRQHQLTETTKKTDEALTLKDQLNDDVLNKLKAAKQGLVEEAKQKEEEKIAQAAFERKQKEKNMSFEELLNQYGDGGSKF